VKKTLTLESEHGEVRIQRVAGAATIDLDRVECEADAIKGKTTVRMEHGNLTLRGISAATEVTGDGSGLELMMASAVPLTATTSNDELMVELPKGGVTFDVQVQHGRLRVPDRELRVEENDEDGERRLNADLRGGGPTIRLRNEHADIVIREGGMMDSDTDASERSDHPEPPKPAPAPEPAPEPLEPPKPPAPPRAPRP
jgi:hypothetical protein